MRAAFSSASRFICTTSASSTASQASVMGQVVRVIASYEIAYRVESEMLKIAEAR